MEQKKPGSCIIISEQDQRHQHSKRFKSSLAKKLKKPLPRVKINLIRCDSVLQVVADDADDECQSSGDDENM